MAVLAPFLPWLGRNSTKSWVIAPIDLLLCGWLAVRAWRAEIRVDARGVTGRADRFTHRIAWSDLDRFAISAGGLGAVNRSGHWIRLADYGVARTTAERHMAALQEWQRKVG
jgi:hypothetical protein